MEQTNQENTTSPQIIQPQDKSVNPDSQTPPLKKRKIPGFILALGASGDINNFGVYISLLAKANVAKGLSFINNKASSNVLRAMQNELEAQKGKKISEAAYNILNNDIQSLLASFSP